MSFLFSLFLLIIDIFLILTYIHKVPFLENLMGTIITLNSLESQPIHLSDRPGFVPQMPFRLLWKIDGFRQIISRRKGVEKRFYALTSSYYNGKAGLETERIYCNLKQIAQGNPQGNILLAGTIRNGNHGEFVAEAILNMKEKTGYVFA